MATPTDRTPLLALAPQHALWLIACALLTLAPQIEHTPAWLIAVCAVGLLWRTLIWWRHWPLPSRWLLTLFVVTGSAAIFAQYQHFFGKDPGVALLVLFLVLKLMELRSVRDALAALFLCYFLLLTQFFYAQDIAIAGMTAVALVVITAALAALAHPARPILAHLRLAGLMLAQALPFMLVLFVLFPRVQGPLWGMPVDAYSGMTGLSDTMSPGSIAELSLSSAIAFRVKFEGDVPQQQQLYWRGPVLHQFDGRSWRAERPLTANKLPYTATGRQISYAVTLEPHNKPWLFALELPTTLPPDAVISSDFQLLAKNPVRARLRYEMHSEPGLIAGRDEPSESLKANLLLPPGNPRTRDLAATWRRETNDDAALVNKALRHFRDEPFVYTLSPPLLGTNSMDDFLFDTQRGFCEHYASAFVFAMRAAGIPTRVVTGYQGGEKNPVDGYVIVRQSDAHAWAEVWLPQRGWVRIDPTAAVAPSRIELGLASAMPAGEPLPMLMRRQFSWLRDVRFQWEAVTNTWNQWVLGYNPERQREVLSRLGMHEPDWRSMTAALTALCGLLMLALTALALRQHQRLDAAQRAWNKLSCKLAPLNLARRSFEGPLFYANRVGETAPHIAAPVRTIADLYITLRYAPAPAPPSEETKTRIVELRRHIANLNVNEMP